MSLQRRPDGARGVVTLTAGVMTSCAGLYGGLWVAARLWPEMGLLLAMPVFVGLGVVVGLLGAVISKTPSAAKITLVVIFLAAMYSVAAGWGHSGWLSALGTYVALTGSVYLGGVVIARRWLASPKLRSD